MDFAWFVMANVNVMKFQQPRDLNDVKDRDSLEHWINNFTVYANKDPQMSPFLTRTWNANEAHMGQEALGDNTAPQMATQCKLFFKHVASFLPFPYFNKHIEQRLLASTRSGCYSERFTIWRRMQVLS